MTKPTLESVAKVLVTTEGKEALVLTVGEHTLRPEKSYTPDLPGGVVDLGETELAAVVRELNEETGIKISPELFTLVYAKTEFFADENKSVSKFLYLLFLQEKPQVNLSWEHSDYSWITLSDLTSSVKFSPFYDEAIKYCLSHELV